MKRFFGLCMALVMIASVTACGSRQEEEKSATENRNDQQVESQEKMAVSKQDDNLKDIETLDVRADIETHQTEVNPTESSRTENDPTESKEGNNMKMNIQVGDSVLTATLVQNSSTEALMEMLAEGPVTIEMSDYANMEKVGPFPHSLPTNDEQISTGAGDLILYQGSAFVIYYDTNSWNFTRLGKIDNMTQQELMDILGDDGVTAVLSLPTE